MDGSPLGPAIVAAMLLVFGARSTDYDFGPGHPLTGNGHVALECLAHQDWLVDGSGADPDTEVGLLLARLRVPERRIRVFPSMTAAWAVRPAAWRIPPLKISPPTYRPGSSI